MKKLMVMIGAVATAFGLFAADPIIDTKFSFESGETGVGDKYDAASAGWTWEGDLLTLGAYADDDYDYSAANSRREEFTAQNSYLKLETTKNETLVYEFDDEKKATDKFVDQLVQFTGFEEPQTNLVAGTKIAVWMSEFVTDDTTDPETTETNLYVTAGDLGKYAKLANPDGELWEIGKWYRLTIKSVGQISEDGTVGFNIYVDGKQVELVAGEATTWTEKVLDSAAAGAMAAGKLFPAISAGAIASVGYNGIGAIDDVMIDDQGPEFARKIPFTVAEPTGLAISSIVDAAGNTVVPAEGVLSGTQVIVTYGAAAGYKLMPGSATTATATISAAGTTINPGSDIVFEEVVAEVVNNDVTTKYAASELYGLLVTTGLVNGDVLTFLADTTILDGSENTVYSFTEGSKITVAVAEDVTTWTINVPGESTWIDDAEGTTAGFNKVYTFENDACQLGLNGNIAGELTAPNVEVLGDIEVSGTLKAAVLAIDSSITLVDSGKVLSQDNELTIYDDEGGEVEVSEEADDDGYYTYAIATEVTFYFAEMEHALVIAVKDASEATIEDDGEGNYTAEPGTQLSVTVQADAGYLFNGEKTKNVPITVQEGEIDLGADPTKAGFAIIIADAETEYYTTLAAAIAAYEEGVITVLDNATIDATVEIAKSVAINLNGKTLTFANTLSKCINAPEAESLTITNGTIAVADGRTNIAKSRAIYLLHNTSVVLKDLTLDLPGFEYVLNKDCDLDPVTKCWSDAVTCTIDCDNVAINGNGSLFHFENAIATLTGCSTTFDDTLASFGGAHEAAIYASCGGETVIEGGTFAAPNALQTGNMGAEIVVKSGTFNGDIKSWMYEGDIRWQGNAASITIQGGTFTGNFAYGTGQAGACTKDCLTWNITAGTFSDNPSAYLANGYKAVEGAGKWTVEAKVFFDSISLDKTALALTVGGTETLVATPSPTTDDDSLVWTSSAEGVATVANGVVTAVAAGEATITVKSANNESVTATCTVTVSAAPTPVEPVNPDEEITVPETPADINESLALKKQYLAAPTGASVGDTYYGYFDAVKGSADGTVKFELNAAGEAALQANANGEVVKIKPDKIAAGTDTSVTIAEPIAGFYYAVKQGNGVGNMKIVNAGVLATGSNTVSLGLVQYPGAGFYSIVVSPTPIAAAPIEK